MVKYSWSETTGHGDHVNWQNNTNSFQEKEENRRRQHVCSCQQTWPLRRTCVVYEEQYDRILFANIYSEKCFL